MAMANVKMKAFYVKIHLYSFIKLSKYCFEFICKITYFKIMLRDSSSTWTWLIVMKVFHVKNQSIMKAILYYTILCCLNKGHVMWWHFDENFGTNDK
jgi:hypothetical protein